MTSAGLIVPTTAATATVAHAATATSTNPPGIAELSPEAQRSYLQYRIPLQISADFYLFELRSKVGNIEEWGYVNELVQTNNARAGQGQPSRLERDFVNPMRILGLSLPPDVSDELRDAQFKFEKAMFALTKATKGYRKDLPVAVSDAEIQAAENAWEDGRVAINEFFTIMNKTVEADELKTIPANKKEYGRSESKYFNLMKKTKLCQNRGGPTLSQTWGGLMITGYMQDSCGIPDLQEYFYQQS